MGKQRTAALIAGTLVPIAASAQLYYQRATPGPTGQLSGTGIGIDDLFYSGWRFQVTDGPIRVNHIGAHFSFGIGTVFGALVQLTGPEDDPDDFALSTPDLLATALLDLPPFSTGSDVVQAPMDVTLQNGWYLILFGSGAFGAASSFGGLMGQDLSTAVPGAQYNITYRLPAHPDGPGVWYQSVIARCFIQYAPACYPNCDRSTMPPILNVSDFSCFINRFATGDTYANCDYSTTPPILNVLDFTCFLNTFAMGCE